MVFLRGMTERKNLRNQVCAALHSGPSVKRSYESYATYMSYPTYKSYLYYKTNLTNKLRQFNQNPNPDSESRGFVLLGVEIKLV